jgi:TRAP-type C4-dicarboxylate transport system substrate-binding protein
VLETNIGNVFCGFIMNQDAFDSMSAEDQQIVDDIAAEYLTDLIVQGYGNVTDAGKEAFLAKGGTVLEMSDEDLTFVDEAFAPIWADWFSDMEELGVPAREASEAMYNILLGLGVEHPAMGYKP